MSKYNRNPGNAIIVAVPEPNLATVPDQAAHPGMSIAQYAAILLAYWKLIALLTLLLIVFFATVIKLLPKTYTATTALIISSDLKDPLAGRDFPAELINNYVATQIELMTSPIVLAPVMQRLHLMEDKTFTGGFKGSDEALRELVQVKLAASIDVNRGTGGQLLYLSVSSRDPVKAALLANTLADVYIEQDRRRLNDPAGERAQRYTEELAELRDKTAAAQDKVTAFRKEHGIDDMNSSSSGTEVQTLDTLHQHLLDTQILRRAQEAKLSGQPTADENLGSAALDAQLAQLAQLSATYGPQHPKVRELNAQIAITRQSIANGKHTETAGAQSELAATRELERKYAQAIAEQEGKVLKLRQAQDEGGKLVLELDSAKSVYKQALDGFDQIMFQAVASHANVSVVNRAIPPLTSSKPKKMKLFLVAILAACGLGFGIPLGYGLFVGRRLRCRDDMERDFGIAVLAQLGAVPGLARAT